MNKDIYVRNMEKGDLASIVDMEERQTGVARPGYWEKRIEMSEAIRPHWASLVAEIDNRVVGFILGRAGELEFGLPGTVAWIEMIGVDPAYRRRGVAQELVEKFAESAEDHGIRTIFTLITSNQTEMQHFFSRLGFVHGKMLHYQKEISN
ncbi:MAG TPA: GNAT family N-acetyltransferase [Terriglobales bacterium]|jgi:ribosomal protein S18 acetylase RimI-like enzyme|nr:GNAT family N-acetyltransferase [Terriglobales bacterium]